MRRPDATSPVQSRDAHWTSHPRVRSVVSDRCLRGFDWAPRTGDDLYETPAVEASGYCGENSKFEAVDPLPISKEFHAGDTISIALKYTRVQRASVLAVLDGYFGGGSPWFEYWCHPGPALREPE